MGNKWNGNGNNNGRIGNLNINFKNDFLSVSADIDFDALADRIESSSGTKYSKIEYDNEDLKQIEED